MRIVFLAALVLLVGCANTVTFETDNPTTITVEVADEKEERAIGLMYRENLPEDRGMIFVFDDLNNRMFWMKNVKINLDMIYLDSDFIVNEVKHNLEPCQTVRCPTFPSQFPAQYVIEVNGGFAARNNIVPGTKVRFD